MKQVTLLLRSFSLHVFCVKARDKSRPRGTFRGGGCRSPCLPAASPRASAPSPGPFPRSRASAHLPRSRRAAPSSPIREDGEPEIYVLRNFYALSRRLWRERLRRSQKPPSVSLFIHAGKAVYSVSGWKLHWDHGLIVLFVELIALFDRPFSHNAWE